MIPPSFHSFAHGSSPLAFVCSSRDGGTPLDPSYPCLHVCMCKMAAMTQSVPYEQKQSAGNTHKPTARPGLFFRAKRLARLPFACPFSPCPGCFAVSCFPAARQVTPPHLAGVAAPFTSLLIADEASSRAPIPTAAHSPHAPPSLRFFRLAGAISCRLCYPPSKNGRAA